MRIAWLDKKRARRGWVLLGLAFVLGLVFFVEALPFESATGYGIEDPDWVIWSTNFPGTWSNLQRSAVAERIAAEAPEVGHQLGLFVRHASGMRWTPARWRFWFGGGAVFTGVGEDFAIGTRARLPMRAALAAARVLGMRDAQSDSIVVNGLHVAVMGNAAVIASSSELLARFRAERKDLLDSAEVKSEISFIQNRRNRFGGTIAAGDELALSVWVDGVPRDDAARDQYFSIDWPEQPIVSLRSRGQSFDLESDVVSDWWSRFPAHEDIDTAWSNFEALLPEGWRTGTDSVQFALFGVDTSDTIPIPDAAVYARSETPLEPLTPPVNAIPYEWSGVAGWMTPWKGEGANLFVVANDRARVFANAEPTMAALMGRERAGRVSSEDASIEIDAPRLADVLINLARNAAKNELWPERNADDVEHEVLPWIRAFGALGVIHLEGHYENGPLVLRGGTQAPPEEESE